jgi:long-chain acyl-CoA synthetase
MLLYTSGTTGQPKGVMLTHANLLANTASIVEYLGLTANDSTVAVLPFFHSFGNSVLLTHLAVGGSVYIENRFTYPSKVVETLQQVRPTGFSGVPATFYILLHRTPFLQRDWSFLRYISQAGGGMRVETIHRLRQAMPATRIYIMYGQTEASARLSYLAPELLEGHTGSIGKAIPGVEIRVVDANGKETATGEVGELTARGANVMAGYWNDPAATAEAIRDGWLYTGDMARRDADGFLYIVSRKSDFIKSASYRISPVEIEEVIASLGGIEDVAAIGVPDSLLGEAIAACVVCPDGRFDAEAIRSQCLAQLPMFKVPRYILHVPEIPRTPSGKKKYYVLREEYRELEGSSR